MRWICSWDRELNLGICRHTELQRLAPTVSNLCGALLRALDLSLLPALTCLDLRRSVFDIHDSDLLPHLLRSGAALVCVKLSAPDDYAQSTSVFPGKVRRSHCTTMPPFCERCDKSAAVNMLQTVAHP